MPCACHVNASVGNAVMCHHAAVCQIPEVNPSQSSALRQLWTSLVGSLGNNPLLHELFMLVLQIPLVGMADELEAQLLESLERRAAVGPTALPSAAFYTFVNSHHTLNCVTSSSNGACVAGQSAPPVTACCQVTIFCRCPVPAQHVLVVACVAGQHAHSFMHCSCAQVS